MTTHADNLTALRAAPGFTGMSGDERCAYTLDLDLTRDTATHACAGDACQVCAMDRASRPEPREGRARHTDPATSHDAARSVTVRAGSQKARLLSAYAAAFHALVIGHRTDMALTDDEAAVMAGLTRSCFWKRCGELREDGLIMDTGRTRLGPLHGEHRMACAITDAGRAVGA
jgi:hypothetical protein